MIFAFITLFTSLALAGVAGWFSISGLVTILAGQPIPALILGITLELGKLVTASWLYRNWKESKWTLKAPLIYFMAALMLTTSMGVFGFLSKAHLEQGSATIDNSAKIAEIDRRIQREKEIIADNDKMISQLDTAVNSFISKEQTNRALSVRRSQAAQRKQLKNDTAQAQQRIDQLSDEKFSLESDLRKLELEVGPIKYIATLIYGESSGDDKKLLESAVRIFTVLVVSTLDPLAITLLIAANFSLMRRKEVEELPESVPENHEDDNTVEPEDAENVTTGQVTSEPAEQLPENPDIDDEGDVTIQEEPVAIQEEPPISSEPEIIEEPAPMVQKEYEPTPEDIKQMLSALTNIQAPVIPKDPAITRIDAQPVTQSQPINDTDMLSNPVIRELIGSHFIPKPVVDNENLDQKSTHNLRANDKYQRVNSWLTNFKR